MAGKHVADDINLFIKDEPHKLSKIAEGRLRLISGVSLIDSIIDKMLFGDLFMESLKHVGSTPGLVGWQPYFGGSRLLLDKFPHGTVSVDKSAWDWSVPDWMIDIFLEFILELLGDVPPYVKELVTIRFKLLFEDAVFSDGFLRSRQTGKGIMKSGCYLTLLLNTVGQVLLHLVVCRINGWCPKIGMVWAFGDDTIQDDVYPLEKYVKTVSDLGFVPKVERAKHIEFVGFLMDSERVIPSYWRKHLFVLKYLDEQVAAETLRSYQVLYYAVPGMLNIIHGEMRRRVPGDILSAGFLDRWVRLKS